jgi:diacylglycerol kinase family enzyme
MKWLAIINSAANHAPLREFQHLAKQLRALHRAECVWTEYPGHAQEIARRSHGYDGCIGVGGDGTLADVVNGLQLADQLLGVIPCGTGNGLARDLGILNPLFALESLVRPRSVLLDLIVASFRVRGDWHERYVISTTALGYTASVTAQGVGSLKHWGKWRYAAAAVAHWCHHHEFSARIRCDGNKWPDTTLSNLVVNNTRHSGNFLMFPEAGIADGYLNVYHGCLSRWRQLADDLAIFSRTYLRERSQRTYARQFEVELDRPALLMLDGELIADVDFVRFAVSPRRLCCCIPGPHLGPRFVSSARGVTSRTSVPQEAFPGRR